MTGYSGTPLLKKLGLKETMKVCLINAPADYMNILEADINGQLVSKMHLADFIHLFATSKKELAKQFQQIIKKQKMVWLFGYHGIRNLRDYKQILPRIRFVK